MRRQACNTHWPLEYRYACISRREPEPHTVQVLRTTHPSDLPPQGVAAAPAPSYVLPSGARPPTAKRPLGPGALSRPASGAPIRATSGALHRLEKVGNGLPLPHCRQSHCQPVPHLVAVLCPKMSTCLLLPWPVLPASKQQQPQLQHGLNTPGQDWLLTRQNRPPSTGRPRNPAEP